MISLLIKHESRKHVSPVSMFFQVHCFVLSSHNFLFHAGLLLSVCQILSQWEVALQGCIYNCCTGFKVGSE